MPNKIIIDCPDRMIAAIRRYGVIPFFKGTLPGFSIEELTAPGCWFTDSEEFGGTLGPWDWKIDCVREGDIAYGKFLGGKAAFATVEYYRHLMNWRRSLARYRMALGEPFKARTKSESMMQTLSPIALCAIREAGALEAGELRRICEAKAPQLAMRKSIMDSVIQFLQMGTWSVIGDFRRMYRGPDLSYNGWQRASNTTPDELFAASCSSSEKMEDIPLWARRFQEEVLKEEEGDSLNVACSPSQSREFLIAHLEKLHSGASRSILERII